MVGGNDFNCRYERVYSQRNLYWKNPEHGEKVVNWTWLPVWQRLWGGWGSKRGREREDLERGDQKKKTKERTLREEEKGERAKKAQAGGQIGKVIRERGARGRKCRSCTNLVSGLGGAGWGGGLVRRATRYWRRLEASLHFGKPAGLRTWHLELKLITERVDSEKEGKVKETQ